MLILSSISYLSECHLRLVNTVESHSANTKLDSEAKDVEFTKNVFLLFRNLNASIKNGGKQATIIFAS
jgi:hypothetical protein